MMNYHGTLIYRERLRRNWSQEGLCRGICSVSYLSKIEKGNAEPSGEVLRLLLKRLKLKSSPELEAAAEKKSEEGYELLFTGCFDELSTSIRSDDTETYRATASALDLLLLSQFPPANSVPLDAGLESCMDTRQLALQRILQGRYNDAIMLLPTAFTYCVSGISSYEKGNSTAAIEHLQKGYELAAEEGCARLMLMCKFFIGSSYSNLRKIEPMLKHYAVAARLVAALGDTKYAEAIKYNIAATQTEIGEYEEAYRYFSKLDSPALMSLHKLSICCEKTGRTSEALEALEKAEQMECDHPPTELAHKLCSLVRFRIEHKDYLERHDYGEMLLSIFERCRRELSAGYAFFHLPWVLEWYKATRQYRKALELMENFPELSL